MITGLEQPDSGSIELGDSVKLAFVEQLRDQLDDDKSVWEAVADGAETFMIGTHEVSTRNYIGRFNFKGGDQKKRVGDLSGGERGRLQLACTLRQGANVLLLDEPSNDLDVETLRALEEAVLAFPGTVMVVSHDRWFLDRIATHILAYEGDSKVNFFDGNYTEYEADRKARLGSDAQPKRMKYKRLA
jgi:sulfate-transporting ATPase